MAIYEWRKFNFFDLRKSVDKDRVSETLKDANITSATNGNNLIVICDSNGNIHVFSRTWEAISFKGHDGSIFLCDISRQNNLLVTVGEDVNGPSFKVWNLSKISPINGAQCLRIVKTALQKPTALAVSEGGQSMAIGFESGNVSLYRGDISRDRSKTLKQFTFGSSQITGIAFKHSNKLTQMFVCSDSRVFLYNLQRDKDIRVDLDTGSELEPARCCSLQSGHNEGHFMVGRDDAVYCYTSDGRGPCYALEGQKSLLQWFRSHLLVITKNHRAKSSAQNATLTVIDIQNKFIVFNCQMDDVAAVLIEFGTCFILTKNKLVFHLDEKDLQSKLNLLYKKNSYDIAVRIAKSNQYDSEGLAGIFKQYGDHLYSKADFSGSVEQYSKTVGFLEPSYVIRRFLDARHINYLTDYLQVLHKQGQATADHTTLLLNCFTRLDRTENLKEFLRNDEKFNLFDVDVAIKVCRSACIEQALVLAKWNQKHDSCLSILTEDLSAYEAALKYIEILPFNDAEKNIKKYGNTLMEHCPDGTIELLKKICTDYLSKRSSNTIEEYTDESLLETRFNTERGNPEDFIHLFSNTSRLIDFLEHLIKCLPTCSQLVFNTLIEHYLYIWESDSNAERRLMEILRSYNDMYDKNHVLIQCRVYKFWPGVMFLYEDEKLYHLIVRHHLKNCDYRNLLESCERLGQLQPSLWLQALTGLRNDANAPTNLLSQVLHVISQQKLQYPLQILNCLAVENGPTLPSIRDYFTHMFKKETESIRHDEELAKKYQDEAISIKSHIRHLQSGNIEFRGTLCDTCYKPLSLPALYFLCQHSYHQDCIRGYSETEKDCPVCHAKNIQLVDALRAQSESRGQHEMFHNLLDRSVEPFSVVAEYFGRGLFNKIVIIEEEESSAHLNLQTENEVKPPKKPSEQVRIDPNAKYNNFGPSAEAKMRQEEGKLNSLSKQLKNEGLNRPVSEARMRLQEQQRYSSSLEANVQRKTANLSTTNMQKNEVKSQQNSKVSPYGSPKPPANMPVTKPVAKESAYDDSKNPFETDAPPSKVSSNPFDAYDNNLDPFAE